MPSIYTSPATTTQTTTFTDQTQALSAYLSKAIMDEVGNLNQQLPGISEFSKNLQALSSKYMAGQDIMAPYRGQVSDMAANLLKAGQTQITQAAQEAMRMGQQRLQGQGWQAGAFGTPGDWVQRNIAYNVGQETQQLASNVAAQANAANLALTTSMPNMITGLGTALNAMNTAATPKALGPLSWMMPSLVQKTTQTTGEGQWNVDPMGWLTGLAAANSLLGPGGGQTLLGWLFGNQGGQNPSGGGGSGGGLPVNPSTAVNWATKVGNWLSGNGAGEGPEIGSAAWNDWVSSASQAVSGPEWTGIDWSSIFANSEGLASGYGAGEEAASGILTDFLAGSPAAGAETTAAAGMGIAEAASALAAGATPAALLAAGYTPAAISGALGTVGGTAAITGAGAGAGVAAGAGAGAGATTGATIGGALAASAPALALAAPVLFVEIMKLLNTTGAEQQYVAQRSALEKYGSPASEYGGSIPQFMDIMAQRIKAQGSLGTYTPGTEAGDRTIGPTWQGGLDPGQIISRAGMEDALNILAGLRQGLMPGQTGISQDQFYNALLARGVDPRVLIGSPIFGSWPVTIDVGYGTLVYDPAANKFHQQTPDEYRAQQAQKYER